MSWCELIDKIECSWCIRFFYTYDFNIIVWNYLRGFTSHVVIKLLYKFLYWDYEIMIQIVSKWKIGPVMNGEIHAYWVVSYELCNRTIVRPFKGDEFFRDEYCDGIHCGDPTSLITSTTR